MPTEKHYAVYDNNGQFELWSEPKATKEAALSHAEIQVLDTFGSRSHKYTQRINGLFTVNEHEARYLKLVN